MFSQCFNDYWIRDARIHQLLALAKSGYPLLLSQDFFHLCSGLPPENTEPVRDGLVENPPPELLTIYIDL